MTTATKTPQTAKPASQPKDAIAMLRRDHKHVASLFEQFEKSRHHVTKKKLVAQICAELSMHAELEEEIFYPAVKAALKDKELVPEAIVEHATLKDLISQVEGVDPGGEQYDAKVKVMSEYVKHHVKEEETEMFPKARKAALDLVALGEEIVARKSSLVAATASP